MVENKTLSNIEFEVPEGFKFYEKNRALRGPNQDIPYTEDMVSEIIRCINDPLYFCHNYVKIVTLDDGVAPFRMYDFQQEFIRTIHENRFTIGLFSRQMGKTTCVAEKSCAG